MPMSDTASPSHWSSPSDYSSKSGCGVYKICSEPAGCSQSCQQVQSQYLGFKSPQPPRLLPSDSFQSLPPLSGAARAPARTFPCHVEEGSGDTGKCYDAQKPKWRVTSRSQPTGCPLVLMSLAPSESWDLWKGRRMFSHHSLLVSLTNR